MKSFQFCLLALWIFSATYVMAAETISIIPPHIQYIYGTQQQSNTANSVPLKYTQSTCHDDKTTHPPKQINKPDRWAMLFSAIGKHMYEIMSSSLVEFNNIETDEKSVFYKSKSILLPGTKYNDDITAFYSSIQDNNNQLSTFLKEYQTGLVSWITLPDNFKEMIKQLFQSSKNTQKINIHISFYDGSLSSKKIELIYDKTQKIFNELSRLKLKYAIINYLKNKHYPPPSDNND